MEEDRAEGNLGIAADLPENEEPVVQRVPKKRFIGRRQAAELALNGPAAGPNTAPSIENSIEGQQILSLCSFSGLTFSSTRQSTSAIGENTESSPG